MEIVSFGKHCVPYYTRTMELVRFALVTFTVKKCLINTIIKNMNRTYLYVHI